MPKHSYKGNLLTITTNITQKQDEFLEEYAKECLSSKADIIRMAVNYLELKVRTEKKREV